MGGMSKKYDHIVVGAGSAGAVLAARLSEDPHRSVLLLEAGGDYPGLEQMPDSLKYVHGSGASAWGSGHMWNLRARATDEADIDIPRGKVTGGSSAVNDAQFLRGMPEDFDRWAEWGMSRYRVPRLSGPQSAQLHRRWASALQHRRPGAGEHGNWLPQPRAQS